MCGIAGRFNFSPEYAVDQELVQRMTRLIAYRGPDDEGFYFDGNVGLGNRRLTIIDPKHGHQPIHNEDKTVWVTFNGEVYNYIELREHLQTRGHRFYTDSDTEVIVHLYEEYGPRFVERINGMFAIALWDSKKQTLFLYRDRLGVKPLYFGKTESGVVFASEIKCLLLDAEINRSLDSQSLFDLMTFGYVPPPGSLFKGVTCMLPGYFAICDRQGLQLEKYWDIPLEVDESRSEQQYALELLELLTDATRLRLRSDVPIGAFLSGGVDSSTVVGLMSRLLDRPVATFSTGFKEDSYSELKFSREVSELFRTVRYENIVDPNLASLLPKVIWYCDEPHGDASFLALYVMAEGACKHATVILSGDGADEFLGGFTGYAEFLAQFRDGGDPLLSYYNTDHISVIKDVDKQRVFSSEFFSADSLQPSSRLVREVFDKARHMDLASKILYTDQKLLLPGNNLIKSDRMGAPHAVECRSPYLDYRVAEFVARMPSHLKIRAGTTKYILKKAVEPLLPREIVHRPKQMFTVPIGEWFKNGLREFTKAILLDPRFENRKLFDRARVEDMLRAHHQGQANYTRQIRLLLNLELWFQMFVDRKEVVPPKKLTQEISVGFGKPSEVIAKQTAEDVRRMYNLHPFPPEQRRGTYREHTKYLRKILESRGFATHGKKFADLACGTCAMLVDHALEFPEMSFYGMDITEASLEIGRKYVQEKGLKNIAEIRQTNLMDLDLKEAFDVILSWGTVHHLPDPRLGLTNILRALKPGGICRVGIYGHYGNWERRIQQGIVNVLCNDKFAFDERIKFVRAWIKGDPKYKNIYTAPAVDIEDDDWVVDEFLHVWERHISLVELYDWFAENDVELFHVSNYYNQPISLDIATYNTDEDFVLRAKELPLRDRLKLLDLLERPYWISSFGQKKA